jgi:hypothetical protein
MKNLTKLCSQAFYFEYFCVCFGNESPLISQNLASSSYCRSSRILGVLSELGDLRSLLLSVLLKVVYILRRLLSQGSASRSVRPDSDVHSESARVRYLLCSLEPLAQVRWGDSLQCFFFFLFHRESKERSRTRAERSIGELVSNLCPRHGRRRKLEYRILSN